PFGRRLRLEAVSELALELPVVAGVVGVRLARPALVQVHAADGLAEVLPERLLRRHEQHVAVGRFVHLIADAFAHAGGPRRASLVVVAGVSGYLGLAPPLGLPFSDPRPALDT